MRTLLGALSTASAPQFPRVPTKEQLEVAAESRPIELAELVDIAIALGILAALSVVMLLLTWMVALPLLRTLIKRSRFEWDDVFLDAKTFRWLGFIPPAVVFALATQILHSKAVPIDLQPRASVMDLLQNFALGFIVFCMVMAFNSTLTALNVIYRQRNTDSRSRPIKGFVQLGKIFISVVGSICSIALVFGEPPWEFLKYSAGMTAVLLFVFKDTILSLVASIQLTSNNMVKVGDWIEVPSLGVDGDVIDVALHTVKVRSFDKTIVTVPTRKLVEGTFKNWWGMQESGGRRIKRDLHIDQSTIRFLSPEEIDRFKRIDLLREYLTAKQSELAAQGDVGEVRINGRQLTNIGTFRAYVVSYLRSLPVIHERFTFLIRQLQPGPEGLPLQLYIFTKTTNWVEYENIQSDLFDHLLAVLPEFGLRVFQAPTGHDFASLREIAGPDHS